MPHKAFQRRQLPHEAWSHISAPCNGLQDLFDEGTYSDLVVTCKGRNWKVHKSFVSKYSAFFRSASYSDFKEAKDGVINLPEDDPSAMHCMLAWFYGIDLLPSHNGSPATSPHDLLHFVHVYVVARKYLVAGLDSAAVGKMAYAVKRESMWDCTEFIDAVEAAYSDLDGCAIALDGEREDAMKYLLVDTCVQQRAMLQLTEELRSKVRGLFDRAPDFARDFALMLLDQDISAIGPPADDWR